MHAHFHSKPPPAATDLLSASRRVILNRRTRKLGVVIRLPKPWVPYACSRSPAARS